MNRLLLRMSCLFLFSFPLFAIQVIPPHVVVLNEHQGIFARYKKWIPSKDFRVDFIVNQVGLEGVQADYAGTNTTFCLVEDLGNYDELLRCGEKIKKEKGPIDFVVSDDERLVGISGKLRTALNVTYGLNEEEAKYFRNKLVSKRRIVEKKIQTADFIPFCSTKEEIDSFIAKNGFPMLIKPLENSGSEGIVIFQNRQEFDDHVSKFSGSCSEFLLEKFIDGDIYHVDGIVSGGKLVWARSSIYWNSNFDYYRMGKPTGSVVLPQGELSDTFFQFAQTVSTALSYSDGVFHLEVIKHPVLGLHFLEIAGRSGGALIYNMMKRTYGINMTRESIRSQLKIAPVLGEKSRSKRLAAELVVPPKKFPHCVILESRMVDQEKLTSLKWSFIPEAGLETEFPNEDWGVVGQFIYEGDDYDQVLNDVMNTTKHWVYRSRCMSDSISSIIL